MRTMIVVVCGALLWTAACGTARVVRRTQTGGTLALEGDQRKAQDEAHKIMSQHCQGPYTIIEEGEYVVGTDTAHTDETYVAEDGTVVNEGGQSTRQATEWRITYQCGSAGPPPPPPGPPAAPPADYGEPPPDDYADPGY